MQIANFGESALNSPNSFRRNGQADESAAAIYNLHFSIFNFQCNAGSKSC